MLAIPLVVPKAMFTLLKSSDFTIRCWYMRSTENIKAPVQNRTPPLPFIPAAITRRKVIKWMPVDMNKAFFLPVEAGKE